MAIYTNFDTAVEDLLCSERAAVGGFNDLIIFKLYEKIDLERFGIKVDGIRLGDGVVSLISEAVYNAIPYTDADDCDITSCDVTPNYEAKAWELAFAECRYPLCTRTASRKFMAFYNKYKVLNPEDSEYDFIINQMADILSDILATTLLAKVFLSDKTLTNELALNKIDGLLAQWASDPTRLVDLTPYYTNDVIDGEGIYKAIKDMERRYRRDPYTKNSLSDAIIIMDENHANDLIDWLNDLGDKVPGDCTCYSADGIVRKEAFTLDNLYIKGIKVETIPLEEMSAQFPSLVNADDEVIRDFFLTMTVRENNQFGSPKLSEFANEDMFYDKKDRMYYFDIGYQFGVMVSTPVYLHGFHEVEVEDGGDGGEGDDPDPNQ